MSGKMLVCTDRCRCQIQPSWGIPRTSMDGIVIYYLNLLLPIPHGRVDKGVARSRSVSPPRAEGSNLGRHM